MKRKAICFGCDLEQEIHANLKVAHCVCGGNVLPLLDLNAFRIARLAHRLAGGYYAHLAVLDLVAGLPEQECIDYCNVRDVRRKDGSKHVYAFDFYFREAVSNPQIKTELDRVWAIGALLTLGDEIKKAAPNKKAVPKHFYHAPHLELVRHLRNGVAHGNRFRIDNPKELITYPANNFNAPVKSPNGSTFEITDSLKGPVLFDFLGPADLIDLFQSVEMHLFSHAVETMKES
jgi:hypothetical protein